MRLHKLLSSKYNVEDQKKAYCMKPYLIMLQCKKPYLQMLQQIRITQSDVKVTSSSL
jgi:hypothetical protein